jgi:hypothetical protein
MSSGLPIVVDRMKSSFAGRWRIVEMEQWDQEFVDLVSPGHITFTLEGRGELHFGAVDVSLDWRVDATGNRVDFAFEGFDEGDEVSGTGWAELNGGKLTGRIAFHSGDESGFVAQKAGKARR